LSAEGQTDRRALVGADTGVSGARSAAGSYGRSTRCPDPLGSETMAACEHWWSWPWWPWARSALRGVL